MTIDEKISALIKSHRDHPRFIGRRSFDKSHGEVVELLEPESDVIDENTQRVVDTTLDETSAILRATYYRDLRMSKEIRELEFQHQIGSAGTGITADERAKAQRDADLGGTGFLVRGVRVDPAYVTVVFSAPTLREHEQGKPTLVGTAQERLEKFDVVTLDVTTGQVRKAVPR